MQYIRNYPAFQQLDILYYFLPWQILQLLSSLG